MDGTLCRLAGHMESVAHFSRNHHNPCLIGLDRACTCGAVEIDGASRGRLLHCRPTNGCQTRENYRATLTPWFYESLDRLRFPFNSGNDPRRDRAQLSRPRFTTANHKLGRIIKRSTKYQRCCTISLADATRRTRHCDYSGV